MWAKNRFALHQGVQLTTKIGETRSFDNTFFNKYQDATY
jgi:hypothetical protein